MRHLDSDLAPEPPKSNTKKESQVPFSYEEEGDPWKSYHRILIIILVILFYSFVFYLGAMGQVSLGNLVPLSRIAQTRAAALKQVKEEAWADEFEKKFGNSEGIPDSHPGLIEMIRIRYLSEPRSPPPRLRLPFYNATTPLSLFIRRIFRNKTDGFFLEYRNFDDGEMFWESSDFEKNLGWNGLLILPHYALALRTLRLYRNAWVTDLCLSTLGHPHKMYTVENVRTPSDFNGSEVRLRSEAVVQCVPLYSLMLSVNITTIDFFHLDAADSAYKILKLLPYHLLRIGVIAVGNWEKRQESQIQNFLESKGYRMMNAENSEILNHRVFVNDVALSQSHLNSSIANS